MYTFLNANRRDLKLEHVWTINGRIKYKFFGNNRPFEIRSYADYYHLINNTKQDLGRDRHCKISLDNIVK